MIRRLTATATSLTSRVRQVRAAIDLASIMVGVIVIGIIASALTASVFGVIPWTQDRAAEGALESVATAEASVRADPESGAQYLDLAGLIRAERLPGGADSKNEFGDPNLTIVTGNSNTCWVAIARSNTGTPFTRSSSNPKTVEVTEATTSPGCVDDTTFADAVAAAGGVKQGSITIASKAPFAVGSSHTVALISGRLSAMGDDVSGALGLGAGDQSGLTVLTELPETQKFKQVEAGWNFTVALDKDGHIWTWGNNGQGQLGDGTSNNQDHPVKLNLAPTFTQIMTTDTSVVAITVDGEVWAWGSTSDGSVSRTPTKMPTPAGVKILEGNVQNQYLRFFFNGDNGKVYSWDGEGTAFNWVYSPASLHFTQMSGTYEHVLALDTEGKIWGWTNGMLDHDGALGAGRVYEPNPIQLTDGSTKFASVAAGTLRSAALDEKGKLYRWGDGSLGADAPTKAVGSTKYKWVKFVDRKLYAEQSNGVIVVSSGSNTDDWAMTPIAP